MATTLLKTEYLNYDAKTVGSLSMDKLFVDVVVDGKKQKVALSKLLIETDKKNSLGEKTRRTFKSYAEFKKVLEANAKKEDKFKTRIFYEKSNVTADFLVEYKAIDVPTNFDSTTIDAGDVVVPYGLNRNISVKGTSFKLGNKDNCILVEINGVKDFVRKGDIYYYDENNIRHDLTNLTPADINQLKTASFRMADGSVISRIYLEKEFKPEKINMQEKIDTTTLQKTSYTSSINKEGKTVLKSIKSDLTGSYSEISYLKRTIDDPNRIGKTIEASYESVKVYELQQDGEYVAVTINDQRKMVKLEDILDENGKALEKVDDKIDLTKYVGKKLKVKIGEETFDINTLSYEQAVLRYNTKKVFKEAVVTSDDTSVTSTSTTDSVVTEDFIQSTYLKLKNGEHVKETDVVKPISYRLPENEESQDNHKWLVKTKGENNENIFVVVDKDYFTKNGDKTDYKQQNAIKVVPCAFEDEKCVVAQTTSTGAVAETCVLVHDVTINSETIEAGQDLDKNLIPQGIMSNYVKGNYAIDTYYKKEEVVDKQGNKTNTYVPVKLHENKKRYELSDTIEYPDYADTSLDYRALKTNDITIKDGKAVGGASYDIGEGIAASYSIWGQIFGKTFGLALLTGFFIFPAGATIFGAYMTAMMAAIPGIPIVNLGIGAIKNLSTKLQSKYKNKTETNDKKTENIIQKDIKALNTRLQSKDLTSLSRKGFDEQYDQIMFKILRLSAKTTDSGLSVVDGVATVTPENANKSNEYIKHINSLTNDINKIENHVHLTSTPPFFYKGIDGYQKYIDKLEKSIEKDEAKGKVNAKKLQQLEDAKAKLKEMTDERDALQTQKDVDLTTYVGEVDYFDESSKMKSLVNKANSYKIYAYVKHFADDKDVKVILDTCTEQEKEMLESLTYHNNEVYLKGTLLSSTKKQINENYIMSEDTKKTWLSLQEKLLKLNNPDKVNEKPVTATNPDGTTSGNNNETNLEDLNSKANNLENEIADINKKLSELKNQISSKKGQITRLTNKSTKKIGDLTEEDLNAIRVEIKSLTDKKDELTKQYNDLLKDRENKLKELGDIKTEIEKLTTAVDGTTDEEIVNNKPVVNANGNTNDEEIVVTTGGNTADGTTDGDTVVVDDDGDTIDDGDTVDGTTDGDTTDDGGDTVDGTTGGGDDVTDGDDTTVGDPVDGGDSINTEDLEAELISLYKEINSKDQTIKDLGDTKKGLEDEIEKLKIQLENSLSPEEIQKLKNELEAKKNDITKLEANLSALQLRYDELDKIKQQKEAELKKAQKDLETANKKIEELKEYETKYNEAQDQINSLTTQKDNLQKELDEKIKLVGEKDETIIKLRNDIDKYKEEIKNLSNTAKKYKTEIDKLNKQITKLKEKNGVLKKENTKLKKENAKLEEENTNVKAENETLLKILSDIVSNAQQEIGTIDDLLKDINKKINLLDAEIDKLYKEHNDIVDKINQQQDPKELNTLIRKYRSNLKNIDAQIKQNIKDLNGLREKATNIETRVKSVKNETSKRIKTIEEYTETSERQSREVDKVNDLELFKIEKKYKVSINSENYLRTLLEQRDNGLIKYLENEMILLDENDIKATIEYIKERHKQNKTATTSASRKANKNIQEILEKGQMYITKNASYDPTDIVDIL